MKLLIALLILLLSSGCTMYAVEKTAPDGSSTSVSVKSTRDLDQPELHYQRGDSNGHASFDFKAASVDNNTDAFLGMFQGMMGMMGNMMETMMLNMAAMQEMAAEE